MDSLGHSLARSHTLYSLHAKVGTHFTTRSTKSWPKRCWPWCGSVICNFNLLYATACAFQIRCRCACKDSKKLSRTIEVESFYDHAEKCFPLEKGCLVGFFGVALS